MKYKMFIADVDNTLRGFKMPKDGKMIPLKEVPAPGPKTREALNKMHEEGMIVGIASGRPLWQEVTSHAKDWGLDFEFDYCIGMNGGEIVFKGDDTVYRNYPLSPDQLKTITEAFKDLEGTTPFIYREGYELALEVDENMKKAAIKHHTDIRKADLSELCSQPTGKILYRCKDSQRALEVEAYGKKIFGDRLLCFKTGPALVEIQDPRVHKGLGMELAAKHFGIDLKDVIAFGDAGNDIEMLEAAGFSICLENGMPEAKEKSDDVTQYPAYDDGVGKYIFSKEDIL